MADRTLWAPSKLVQRDLDRRCTCESASREVAGGKLAEAGPCRGDGLRYEQRSLGACGTTADLLRLLLFRVSSSRGGGDQHADEHEVSYARVVLHPLPPPPPTLSSTEVDPPGSLKSAQTPAAVPFASVGPSLVKYFIMWLISFTTADRHPLLRSRSRSLAYFATQLDMLLERQSRICSRVCAMKRRTDLPLNTDLKTELRTEIRTSLRTEI